MNVFEVVVISGKHDSEWLQGAVSRQSSDWCKIGVILSVCVREEP